MALILKKEYDFIKHEALTGTSYHKISLMLIQRYGHIRGLRPASVKLFCQQNNLRGFVKTKDLETRIVECIAEVSLYNYITSNNTVLWYIATEFKMERYFK